MSAAGNRARWPIATAPKSEEPDMVLVDEDSAAWVKRPETQDEVFARDVITDHLASIGAK